MMTRHFAIAVVGSWLAFGLLGAGDVHAQEDTTEVEQDSAEAEQDSAQQNGLTNPYEGDEEAVAEGKKLWMKYNCYGCHGTAGGGGMGPALVDSKWKYGRSDADVFETISKGRGQGMPAFGEQIPEDEMWKIITYLRSLTKD